MMNRAKILENILSRLNPKSTNSFLNRAGLVLIGSILGQGIAFILLPLTVRIYSVETLGQAASTLALFSIVGLVACMQLDQALIVATDQEVPYIVILGLGSAVAWVLLLGLVLQIFQWNYPENIHLLNSYGLNRYLLLLIFVYSIFLLLINYRLRANQLAMVSLGRLIYYGGGATLQVAGGYAIGGTEFVYLAAVGAAAIIAILVLIPYQAIFRSMPTKIPLYFASTAEISKCARKYVGFTKYQTGAQLLNVISVQFPIFILRAFFSDAWAGWYFMALRLLGTPTALLSQAIGQIFYRDSAEDVRNGKLIHEKLEAISTQLIRICIIPLIFVVCFADSIIGIFLGEEWLPLGLIVQILIISYLAAFFTSPLSTLLNVSGKQVVAFRFNAALFLVRISACGLGWFMDNEWVFLWTYSITSMCVYLLLFRYIIVSSGASMAAITRNVIPALIWRLRFNH